jgi:lipopolysaccharide transport system ATP-binding protein
MALADDSESALRIDRRLSGGAVRQAFRLDKSGRFSADDNRDIVVFGVRISENGAQFCRRHLKMKPIIRVENLSKRYTLGGAQTPYSTLRESIVQTAKAPINWMKRGGKSSEGETLWALKDVNFQVMPAEVIGVVGRNGAGKSTLLKILSRVVEPTTGKIELYGRIGSLLEVGTGFHPELTGRENIFLNGAILGMRREEIAKKFDEIVDFAEIEQFLDTPVKRYSSGMYTRLAFAVAANLEPEILVVDEVLSVGDAEFQKKCLGKMKSVSNSGRTVLFVSHNIDAIRNLCSSCVVLSQGKIVFYGETNSAVNFYGNNLNDSSVNNDWVSDDSATSLKPLKLIRAGIGSLNFSEYSYELRLDFTFRHNALHKDAFLAIDVQDSFGVGLMQAIPTLEKFLIFKPGGETDIKVRVALPPLIPGDYYISVWTGSHNSETLDFEDKILRFEVQKSPTPGRIIPHTIDHGHIVPYSELLN